MKSLFIILLLSASISSFANQPEISKKVYKELKKHFEIEGLELVEMEKLSNETDLFLQIFHEKELIGTIVLTSAQGRYDKFDFMIIYNKSLKIELIKILIYRSDYGSEITAKNWLKQFYSISEKELKYGSDIQAISGATFSAVSLTKNVNRINKIVKENLKN